MDMKRWTIACAAVLLVSSVSTDHLHAQERAKRFTVWDIHLGDSAAGIPNEYVNYACGTNGGPPSIPIPDFTAFKKCKPDSLGLREVYFEYDDELEYQARALDIKPEIRIYAGTTAYEFPIVASVLFDDSGKVAGIRMVTDPRQHLARDYREFWELGTFLRQRFGDDNWSCQDLPAEDGEQPAGSLFVKNHCTKTLPGAHLILEQRFLRKKGQQIIDPNTGAVQPQALESATRFVMYDAAVPLNAKLD